MLGQTFGNYQTLSLLGEGGMGSVYLAEHPTIGRRVAIKVLRPEFAKDQLALGRFVNEARAANAIRHPNIIEILDSGTTAGGLPYLVMELLEGESLRARLGRVGRLPPLEALDVAYLTASALAAAHARNIVHRDLKPDNLYLIPDPNDPARGTVKVLDFGIAKLQQTMEVDSLQTKTGTVVGSPSYMSPEQCLGTKTVDGRTDIYALGVVLFEMLCGRTPFRSLGFGELVHLHVNVAPPRPRELVEELPEEVEAIVLRCLAKQPDERFASMEELMDALDAASEGWLGEHRKSARRQFTAKLRDPGGPRAAPAGRGKPAGRWLLVGFAAMVLAGLGVSARRWWAERAAAEPRPETRAVRVDAAPAAPLLVNVRIDSRPPGAEVIRVADGASLGTTPVEQPFTRGGVLEVRIELPGHLPAVRSLALDRDRSESVALRPLEDKPRPRPPAKRPRPAEAAYEPSKL